MRTPFFIAVIVALVAIAIWLMSTERSHAPEPVACTMEAKLCPDGTAVGRTGPNCEFAACPGA